MENKTEFRIFDRLESTNSEAANHIADYTQPIWIWTKNQTKGKGRSGRVWHSGSNNFFASYLQKLDESLSLIPLRSFVAGLALHETLNHFTEGKYDFYLKWPNDVVLMRKKVGGILLENINSNGENYLITGFGVNLHEIPNSVDIPTRKLDAGGIYELTGFDISSREFLDMLAEKIMKFEKTYQFKGFLRIRELWNEHAFDLRKQIMLHNGKEETRGTFEGIDKRGKAIIATHQGKKSFSAGDMYFRV